LQYYAETKVSSNVNQTLSNNLQLLAEGQNKQDPLLIL